MIIDDSIINDDRLKLQDIGLLIKLIKLNPITMSEYELSNIIPNHSRSSIRSSLNRLTKCGYISRLQHRDINGNFSYCEWFINSNRSGYFVRSRCTGNLWLPPFFLVFLSSYIPFQFIVPQYHFVQCTSLNHHWTITEPSLNHHWTITEPEFQ